MVVAMAKAKNEQPQEAEYVEVDPDRDQTTIRIYVGTSRKIKKLAALREMSIPEMVENLLRDLLDHELLEASEQQAAESRASLPKKKPQ